MDPECLEKMIQCCLLTVDLNKFRGATLFASFRLLSIIFEDSSQKVKDNVTTMVIKSLCLKWDTHQKNEQMVSPLIECLVILC